jgi:hypothetical protein
MIVEKGVLDYDVLSALVSHGAYTSSPNLEIRKSKNANKPTGYGVYVKQGSEIKCGEKLFHFPQSHIIIPSGKIKEFIDHKKCSSVIGLVFQAMHELFVKQNIAPYFKYLLSQQPPNIAHLWNNFEKKMLSGTSLVVDNETCCLLDLNIIYERDVIKLLQELGPELFPKNVVTKDNFFTAFAYVFSRATQDVNKIKKYCDAESSDHSSSNYVGGDNSKLKGIGDCAFIPIFDMINHVSNANLINCSLVNLNLDDANNAFEVYAEKNLVEGDEILVSYGNYGSSDLIRQYGFFETSVYSKVIITKKEVVESIKQSYCCTFEEADQIEMYKMIDEKLMKLKNSLQFFALEKHELLVPNINWSPPKDFMTLLQVLIMEDDEFSEWEDAGYIQMGIEYLDVETSNIVFLALIKLMEICCLRYKNGPELTNAANSKENDDIATMCKCLVHEEMEILMAAKEKIILMIKALTTNSESDDDEDNLHEENDIVGEKRKNSDHNEGTVQKNMGKKSKTQ